MNEKPLKAVIFDAGNVLVRIKHYGLFRAYFNDKAKMEKFLSTAFNGKSYPHWNKESARKSFDEMAKIHPEYKGAYDYYYDHYEEAIKGPVDGMPELLQELKAAGIKIIILSNFGDDTFARAAEVLPFLKEADAHLISGALGVKKPDPAIYEIAKQKLAEFGIAPEEALFFDDKWKNIKASRKSGIPAEVFIDSKAARKAIDQRRPPQNKGPYKTPTL